MKKNKNVNNGKWKKEQNLMCKKRQKTRQQKATVEKNRW